MPVTVADIPYDINKPTPTVTFLYSYPLRNVPGFSVLNLRVAFPPGGASPPHRHGNASVSVVVLQGSVYNKMNDSPTQLLTEDETWYEAPGCHHRTSNNASETEEAVILATFVVETEVAKMGVSGLVIVDDEFRHVKIGGVPEVSG